MKKTKLLSVVLTLALVFTTVFAGAGTVYAGSENEGVQVQIEKGSMPLGAKALKKKANSIDPYLELNCTNVLTSSTSTKAYTTVTMPVGSYWLTSVTPKYDGLMYLDVKVTGTEDTYDCVDVYYVVPGSVKIENDQLTWQYYQGADEYSDYYWYAFEGERTQTQYEPIPVEGGDAYQILFVSDNYNDEPLTVEARAKAYRTGNRELSEGSSKWTIASGLNRSGNTSSIYFKVKPSKTGVMNVSLKEYGYTSSTGYVTLYNADKNARSEKVSYNSNSGTVKFGVKKGTTYYLKVTNCEGTANDFYKYGIKYTMSSGIDRSIGSKSSAKQIYRKADSTYTTFVAANSNSVDYYKFKVTTARSTKITVKNKYMSSGYTTMKLYKSNGTLIKSLKVPAGYEGYISSSNLAKGTYYVKITKSLKNNGKYSIRWTY